jgi:(+)-beta-caryophyllene/(+)-caryolan-1-ol synthase
VEIASGNASGTPPSGSVPGLDGVAFHMPYPYREPSRFLGQARAALAEWLRSHRLVTSEQARAHLERTRPDLLAARYHPDADLEALAGHARWTAWGFLIDDELDDGPARGDPEYGRAVIGELVETVVAGRAPRRPYTRALAELWEQTVAGRSSEWRRIYLDDFCSWLWTYHTGALRRADAVRLGLADYVAFRCQEVGVLWVGVANAEAALGIDLPAYVRHLPAFDGIRHLACEHIGLLNDIFSLANDRALGTVNAVDIVMAEQRCDQASAIGHVNTLLTRKLVEIARQEAALPVQLAAAGADDQVRSQAAACGTAYKAMVRGNHDWHFEVRRYTAPETIRDGSAPYVQDLFKDPPENP